MVWLLQTRTALHLRHAGRICQTTIARDAAEAKQVRGVGQLTESLAALAERLLRSTWAFHDGTSPCDSEPISMKQPPTGEPCAGEPPARFGGRGGASLPDPYQNLN